MKQIEPRDVSRMALTLKFKNDNIGRVAGGRGSARPPDSEYRLESGGSQSLDHLPPSH
jgi:hypothetical protein